MLLFLYFTFLPCFCVLTELAWDFTEYLKCPSLASKVVSVSPERWTHFFLWTPFIFPLLGLKKWEQHKASSSWLCVKPLPPSSSVHTDRSTCAETRSSTFCFCLPLCTYRMGRKGNPSIFQILSIAHWGNVYDYCRSTMNPEELSHEQSLGEAVYSADILEHQN